MTTLLFFKKFWPFGIIVVLAFVVMFMRTTIATRTADRDAARARVAEVTEANKSLNDTVKSFAQQRVDNDAIAEAVAARIGGNTTRLVETRTIIEKAKRDDPVVRAWGALLVPSSVREALRARPKPSGTP